MHLSGLPRSQAPRSPIQLLTAISVANFMIKVNHFNETPIRPIKTETKRTDQYLDVSSKLIQSRLDYRPLTKTGLIANH